MSSSQSVMSNFIWKFLEQVSSQGVSFVVFVILARLLLPEQFGIVAMIQIFMVIAHVFVVSGFSTSLIQKKDADELDFSTIFYCSFIVSVVIYIILIFCAPLISSFYNEPLLTPIVRVYAVTLLFASYQSVQQAWVSRQMLFRKFFYSTLVGTIFSGAIGIFMAYRGYGVWALVSQSISAQILNILVLRFIIKWRLKFIFSFKRARGLMKYGWNILNAELIGTIYSQLRQLCIGKFYTSADLAFYNRGKHISGLAAQNVEITISSVLFPAMSNCSDDTEVIKRMTRKSIQVSSFVIFFFMTSLIIIAPLLVRLLLTDKWMPCVPYLQLICLSNMVKILSTANLQAIKACGRSDVYLKLEYYKKPIGLILIAVTVPVGVMALAITEPVYSIYAAIVNMKPNKKILNYGYVDQLKDIAPSAFVSIIMFAIVYPCYIIPINDYCLIFFQLVLCVLIYLTLSRLFKIDAYTYCKQLLLNKIKK